MTQKLFFVVQQHFLVHLVRERTFENENVQGCWLVDGKVPLIRMEVK